MNDHTNKVSFAPQLSRIRTFLFWGLALVWFSETLLHGFQSLSKVWTYLWQVVPAENPQLAAGLYIAWAVSAPTKGALFVLAVFGLRSKNPSIRTALFASMALVPPLNMAFPFREQGFLLQPMMVATILSTILWGSFFLFREHSQQLEQNGGGSGQLPPSRWEIFRYIWFAANSAALTLMAFLYLFETRTVLSFILPCLSSLQNADTEGLSSLIPTIMVGGTHLLALAIASWIATMKCRSNPTLRQTLTVASTVHAGLFFIFPLRQILMEFGGNCATSSLLIAFAPLFVGWVLYAIIDRTRTGLERKEKTMNDRSNKQPAAPQLSKMRTFLFGALSLFWFAEMVQWGFLASSGGWQSIWTFFPSEAPQLATALSITHAIRAAAKGALGVMAIFGLRSKNPATRTALFVSMALVPPLNIVFPCRADGFPLGTTAVAAVFSIILWGSFFLFRESTGQPEQKGSRGSAQLSPSRWETVQYIWFVVNSIALTLMAFLFLFVPRTALDLIFPSLSGLLNTYETGLSSMTSSNLSSGTHLLALAIACWIATVYCRSNPALRQAMAIASAVHAGLICLLPLRRIILEIGGSSATFSILVAFVPLLVGWVFYAALSYRVELKQQQEAYI